MALPGVGQAEMLATQFARLLSECTPASVAVIGCAGGNGFDRVRVQVTKRLVGIDINPQYVQELAYRHAARIPGLELYVRDIEESLAGIAPVELIYAALVMEYVDPAAALRNLASLCLPDTLMAIVLQLPGGAAAAVADSPFSRINDLAAALRLVPPPQLAAWAAQAGFVLLAMHQIELSSGKRFALQLYQRRGAQRPPFLRQAAPS